MVVLKLLYVDHCHYQSYFVFLSIVGHFVKQGLWLRLLKLGATDDPLSSFEYGTILGMLCKNSISLLFLRGTSYDLDIFIN